MRSVRSVSSSMTFSVNRGGTFDDQLGAVEAGLDDGGLDAVRLHVDPQRLHPALQGEFGGGVDADVLQANEPGEGAVPTGELRMEMCLGRAAAWWASLCEDVSA